MNRIFRYEGGRRYLRDSSLPYPLPVDLTEIHRQTLRTFLLVQLWGAPFCNKVFDEGRPPSKVLEVACGSGLWSTACHDFFRSHGHDQISFTGMDIAPLAPHMGHSGLKWRFVQHDMQKRPWPFPDHEFDFVFIKDASLCDNTSSFHEAPLMEAARILKTGGAAEIWDGDQVIRSLLPNPQSPPNTPEEDLEHAKTNAVYIVAPTTGFAASQNKFVADYNRWIEQALNKRNVRPAPTLVIKFAFEMGSDSFTDVRGQKLAIPMSKTRWEQEDELVLDSQQLATRETALSLFVQQIEALEVILKEESEKRQDDWDRWTTALKDDLINKKGTLGGECLEVSAWWAKKI